VLPIINRLISGSRSLLVKDGVILEGEATRELIGKEEVRMLLQNRSIDDPSVGHRAYLEPNSHQSVFRDDRA
jgi:uncharacterized membrane protein YcaP (DUF421 family)